MPLTPAQAYQQQQAQAQRQQMEMRRQQAARLESARTPPPPAPSGRPSRTDGNQPERLCAAGAGAVRRRAGGARQLAVFPVLRLTPRRTACSAEPTIWSGRLSYRKFSDRRSLAASQPHQKPSRSKPPDKSVPDKSVPDKSVPDKSVPDKSVPDKSVSRPQAHLTNTVFRPRISVWHKSCKSRLSALHNYCERHYNLAVI